MRAHRIKAHVTPDRPLVVNLPPDVPEADVEVIVLFPESASPEGTFPSLTELNAWLRQQPPGSRTKKEIDRQIEEERAAWD